MNSLSVSFSCKEWFECIVDVFVLETSVKSYALHCLQLYGSVNHSYDEERYNVDS